jgi:hypothetical protein
MKRLFAVFCALAAFASAAQAQWYTKTYELKAGWNSIWLSGDASYGTMDELFPASSGVLEVWRWNPNPDKVLFTQTPSTATVQSDEWTIWTRGGSEALLQKMVGNSAYLVNCQTATSLSIKQKSIPPEATWLRSGANFIGFPVKKGNATFSSYFSRMLTGDLLQPRGLLTTAKIFSYVGGALGSSNPARVLLTDSLEPDKPYWFDTQAVSDFYGPLSFETPFNNGLAFGRTATSVSLGVTNRSSSAQTLTFTLQNSEEAPISQTPIATPAPLLRTDSSGASVDASSFSVVVSGSGRATVEFGINRTGMVDGKVYASTLVITDAAGLMEVRIPVTAQAATPAGLWQCEVAVSAVSSTTAAAARSTSKSQATAQAFPLSFLMHVDTAGKGRLLRQAFVGRLVASGNPLGITVIERLIQGAAVSDVKPLRFFAPIMPRRSPIVETTGSAISGAEMNWSLVHGYTDPSNPFVHAFHPDHDNMDAKFTTPLAEGIESYTVTRNCTLSFTSTPPDNSSIPGWGTTLLGGIYTEVMFGVNKTPITLGGMFTMRRISEISTIDTTLK